MKIVSHVCRVGIFAKSDDYFRLQGQAEGQIQYITLNEFVVGTTAQAQVVLADKTVGDYRLRISLKDRELWLEDLGEVSKTIVSGNPIQAKEPFHYKSGEVVQIAKADLIMTFEMYGRNADPQVEGDHILREAKEKADLLISSAQRQVEEKNRLAIEEIHANAEATHQQAKAEATLHGQKIVERAQVTAHDLVVSAKNEVEFLLKDAHAKAASLKVELEKITIERDRLKAETAQCKAAADDAIGKKKSLVQETLNTEAEYVKARSKFEEFAREVKNAEAQWQSRLNELKANAADFEERAKTSQRQQKDADEACAKSKEQFNNIEKDIAALTTKKSDLEASFSAKKSDLESEIKKTLSEKEKCLSEVSALKVSYQSDLKGLREKVDEEFKRQLKHHAEHFQNLREQENLELQFRQKSLENLEAKRLDQQVNQVHKRLVQLVADRAALFGTANLHENSDFKNDLREIAGQALIEEFQLRRRDVLATLPSSRRLLAKKRFSHRVSRYAGWFISICLLGLLFYVQFGSSFLPVRTPASIPSSALGH